jgi:hypothetical protein
MWDHFATAAQPFGLPGWRDGSDLWLLYLTVALTHAYLFVD